MRRFLLPFAFLGLAALPGLASAQVTPAAGYTPPDDTPSIKVGATIFLNYTFMESPKSTDAAGNTISANSFETARAYINITGNINHAISFRITPDIVRASGVGNSNVFRMKYGFAQFSLDDWTGDWKQTWVRLGIQQTPLIDYEEGIYRYRFQGTTFTERVGRLTSSDAGVSFHTSLPNNYGDLHVGIYNGEGYSTVEANNQKALQVRFSVRPMATGSMTARGLRLTVFYDKDDYVQSAERNRFVFQGTFEHAHVNVGVDYLDARDQPSVSNSLTKGRGYSVWATPAFKQKGDGPELLFRYDSWEPNSDLSSQKQNTTIAGFAYWFPHQGNVAASLLLDFEQVKFDGFPSTASTATQRRIGVHGLINF